MDSDTTLGTVHCPQASIPSHWCTASLICFAATNGTRWWVLRRCWTISFGRTTYRHFLQTMIGHSCGRMNNWSAILQYGLGQKWIQSQTLVNQSIAVAADFPPKTVGGCECGRSHCQNGTHFWSPMKNTANFHPQYLTQYRPVHAPKWMGAR